MGKKNADLIRPLPEIAADVLECALAWVPEARLIGNVKASELAALALAFAQVNPEDSRDVIAPLLKLDQELKRALALLVTYTEACEGLINAEPAPQVLHARALLAGEDDTTPEEIRDAISKRIATAERERDEARALARALFEACKAAEPEIALAASYADGPHLTMGFKLFSKACAKILPKLRLAIEQAETSGG